MSKQIIVTGGAGFIGSNIVKGLNARGHDNIMVVDDLTDGTKFNNIVDCNISDYCNKDDFLQRIQHNDSLEIEAIFHQGACSDTTEWDGRYMMRTNYQYTKALFDYCQANHVALIYASSAAVYGDGKVFKEDIQYEKPLNMYGYSKFQFDQYLRRQMNKLTSPVIGMRYFNVYGPREQHKGSMASVAFHLNNQLKTNGTIKLFEGCDGYDNGEQRRDFIYVADVVNVNLWFLDHLDQQKSGIYNVGTGRSQPFNDIAKAVIDWHGRGELTYIPFPDHLKGRYQSFTEADISALRAVGYQDEFATVECGVKDYLDWLNRG